MKTSSSILLRTSFDLAVAARTTGMNTPRTRVVIRTVANAARLGAALRRSARSDSRKKKPSLMSPPPPSSPVLAAALVAHDPALAQLHDPASHLVHHVGIVGGDDHRRPGAVHAVEQLHDALGGLGVEVPGRLARQQQRGMIDERPRQRDGLLLAA